MVLLFLGMFIVLLTCFSARKEKRKSGTGRYGQNPSADSGLGYDGHATTQTTRRSRSKRWI